MKKKLIIQPVNGLLNRFRTIASSYILSEYTNRELYVNWLPEWCCNINIGDLIDSSFFKTFNQPINPNDCYIHSGAQRGSEQPFVQEMIDTDKEIIFLHAGGNFYPPQMSLSQFNNLKSDFYRNLPFNNTITDEYKKFKDINPEYFGIHLRFTDRSEYSVDANYISTVISGHPDQKFYICSDDRTSIQYLKSIFGERILYYNVTDLNRNSPRALIQSMVEWLILANSKKIWYSLGSSYSYEACIYNKLIDSVEMNPRNIQKDDFDIKLQF